MEKENKNAPLHVQPGEDEIDLVQLWQTIWRKKKFIGIFFSSVVVIAVVVSLLLPKVYRSTAVVIPISSSGSSISSLLGGLSSILPIATGHGSADSKIMAVLNSRTLRIMVIKELNLVPVLVKNNKSNNAIYKAATSLKHMVSINSNEKLGTISISADFRNPVTAQKVASAYVKNLRAILNKKAFTVQKMNMLYSKKQLDKTVVKIKKYMLKASAYQKKHNIVIPAGLAGSKDSKSLLAYYSIFQTGGPQFSAILAKLAMLQAKYAELEKVYQLAQFNALKNNLYIQVIDQPIIPYKKYKPKRALIVAVSGFAALFVSIFIVFFAEFIKNARERIKKENKDENNASQNNSGSE